MVNVVLLLSRIAWPSLFLIITINTALQLINMRLIGTMEARIAEAFKEVFRDPAVSRAMGILGKHSGEVRAERAAIDKFNENVGQVSPVVGVLAERLDMKPLDLIQVARQFGLEGFLTGNLNPGRNITQHSSIPQRNNQVPEA